MTATDITNLALGKIGANTITALDDEELIRPTYQQALREILRAHDWNFATTRKALPTSSATVPYEAAVRYEAAVPSDWIRTVAVMCQGRFLEAEEYRMEGGYIRSAVSSVTLVYVSANVAVSTFPPDFTEALSTLLASKLASTLLKSPGLMAELKNAYITGELPDAKRNDSLDSPGSFFKNHESPAASCPANNSRRPGYHPRSTTGNHPRYLGFEE